MRRGVMRTPGIACLVITFHADHAFLRRNLQRTARQCSACRRDRVPDALISATINIGDMQVFAIESLISFPSATTRLPAHE
jgi:hypothetical protein